VDQKSERNRRHRAVRRGVRQVRIAATDVARELAVAVVGAAGAALERLSRAGRTELADRTPRRPADPTRWFVGEETLLVSAASALIVPSDDGPGAREAAVVERIDRLLAGSPWRQALYGRGLVALDSLAIKANGDRFANLSRNQQLELLVYVDRLWQRIERTPSLGTKVRSVGLALLCRWDGSFSVVELFPILIRDVNEAFYTSPVCWDWLQYCGPPMPNGYGGPSAHEEGVETVK
jgi:hypothetical protein